MAESRFVSVHAPTIAEIRRRVALAQHDPLLEGTSPEQQDLDFTFRSKNGTHRFELHVLPNWIEGDTLTALVLDVVVHYGDGTKGESFQPEKDTWVHILVEEEDDGNTRASILTSELPMFTLE